MISFTFNIDQMLKDLNGVADEALRLETIFKNKGMSAVKRVAQDIYQESQKLVPVDEHNLKGQARFEKEGDGYSILYRSIDEDTGFNYAMIQHEDMTFKHDNGEQAKYLEQPFKQKIGGLEGEIKKEIKL